MKLEYQSGQTPLPPDWKEDLIPSNITVMGELNEFEAANIAEAVKKYLVGGRKVDLTDPEVLKRIHKDMFSDVWKWAGKHRKHEVSHIGCDPLQISVRVKDLCADVAAWVKYSSYNNMEMAVRFHHRLVAIHPFTNGNGRHSRIVADILVSQLSEKPLPWGGADLYKGKARDKYLEALRLADKGDFSKLIQFATTKINE